MFRKYSLDNLEGHQAVRLAGQLDEPTTMGKGRKMPKVRQGGRRARQGRRRRPGGGQHPASAAGP